MRFIFRLKQVITEPIRTTKMTSTLKNLIMTNHPENITKIDVFSNVIADHDGIVCSRKIDNIRSNPRTIKFRNYANDSPKELKSDVAKID